MFLDRETDHLWLTPSDVTTFLGSPWVFAQHLAVAKGERERWERVDDGTTEITRRRGDEHERAYLAQLKAAGNVVAEIPRATTTAEWESAVALTIEAINDPKIDVVFQAHFTLGGNWRGAADFLERGDQGQFEPVDTKLARSVKPYMIHQLCFYADALAEIQGELPSQAHVVLGDGKRESIVTSEVIHFSRETLAAVERFATEGDPSREYPWPSQQLELSGLADEAEAIWRADDHLILIAGATRKQIEKLKRRKINTCAELAAADPRGHPKDIAPATFARLVRQARLQKTEPPTWELLPPENQRGLALLQAPSPGDIFYDIEGDPLWDGEGSLEYLHGLWWLDPESKDEVFTPLWAHDRAEEKAAFEQLIEIFIARRTAHPDMHIYHYAPYETTALKRLARQYGTCEEELDDLLRNEVFIDLYQVVRQSLQASVENYSIKSMERFYMDARQADVKEGGGSIVAYERFREIADTPEGQALLDSIGEYNEEDCKSTYLLYEWLRERRREAVKEFGWVGEMEPARESEDKQNASPMTGEPSPGELHRAKLLVARERLNLTADKEPDPERAHAMRLLAEVLLFHVREDKSMWWSYFEHCGMSADDLIHDSIAVGGLRPVDVGMRGAKEQVFEFPIQEFKIRIGDQVRDPVNMWPAGTVKDINDKRNWITLRLPNHAAAHPPNAIFPFKFIDKNVIDRALIDLADSLVNGESERFVAAKRFLLRELPYFGERLSGETLAELREQLVEMEGSYLVAQGPPGTGKTFTAADLIVDQLIRGKRVGLTAGTHLAVDNLCHAVEHAAVERGHVFTGVKKDGAGSKYESRRGLIESVSSNEAAAPGSADLVAGTPWLFSREEWRGGLDLIVIDEAGQFSLASALAVGTAATTMLMVGDPNQLPQVIQGAHPIGAGSSALEHVIGAHRTLPEELGVFLPESRRMTPELCDFVSDTFYEGRLSPHECTTAFAPPGGRALNFLPIEHYGNRQDSIEEAMAIVDLIRELGDQGIAPKQIMVVSPFNMQVDLVRIEVSALVDNGSDVRVLTVDKCQGQQAEVVIYTMATSGGEDVPRGFEFLFSANRFNVAISRAKRAAYLVCTPQLLQVDAKSIEQMKLADAFLAFVERALKSSELSQNLFETSP